MGKKLTEAEIIQMIKDNPDTQMFDTCCVCGGAESYMEMNSLDDISFDVICDECLMETYYGKEVIFLHTILGNNEIKTNEQTVKVWNPKEVLNVNPASGCDIIIHGSSTNSKRIFEIGGVDTDTALFRLKKYNSITLFNYCKPEELEQVKLAHLTALKEVLIQSNKDANELIKQQSKLLLSL